MAKVLVVEDEPSSVTTIRYHLQSGGFDSAFASDVAEGWRVLVSESPDIAVIAARLPGSDGWVLVEKMRKDGRFQRLPVIVLGGAEEPAAESRNGLGYDYLAKPFAVTALLAKIRHLIAVAGPEHGEGEAAKRGRDIVHVELVAIGVVLMLRSCRIEGKVYLPPELARFSDAWESIMRDQRAFVPVTDARVTDLSGGKTMDAPAFIEVRKSEVQAVFPMDLMPD